MTRRVTKALNFAFDAAIGVVNTVGENQYIGTASVNIPFQVKEIFVREMFTTTLQSSAQTVNGFIGGTRLTVGVANPAIAVGMQITGITDNDLYVVGDAGTGTLFTVSDVYVLISGTLGFQVSVGDAGITSGALSTLLVDNVNTSLKTGQIISGTGWTTCTITTTGNPNVFTTSLPQVARDYYDLMASTSSGFCDISGTTLGVLDAFEEVGSGATVTGANVSVGTTVVGSEGPGLYDVNIIQSVLTTTLTITNVNFNVNNPEMVQVQSLDGLFPPGSTVGVVVMGGDAASTSAVPFLHNTHHIFDTQQWLRGLYRVQFTQADGSSPPSNAFAGYLCMVCEFVG